MNLKDIISNKNIHDQDFKPYIIAEAGVNHEGNMEIAKKLIDDAKEGGAHAIKFQSYKAESLASKFSPAYWDLKKEPTKSQFELFKKHDKFWKKEFEKLKLYCDLVKIDFLSTPFDVESSIFLNDMMDVFKISSSDLNNRPFIDIICSYTKPIILSTGASTISEIEESVGWITDNGNSLSLLHCILNYPTDDKNANLIIIPELIKKFPNIVIGYSDHTLPKNMKVLETATLLGAKILEKHFTTNKKLPGNDHYHAMDKNDLKLFNKNLSKTIELLGSQRDKILDIENSARKNARRSLVAKKDILKGKVIDKKDITFKRPANGINPKYYYEILGKIANKNIDNDSILQFDMFE